MASQGSQGEASSHSSAPPPPQKAATPSKVQCGSEAVLLLNCLARNGAAGCPAEMEAFVACAGKAGLKEFVLLEECPSSTPAGPKKKKEAAPK
mmetsp:Transcript_14514/g.36430  ORF Transcript_14514/g.36430 Transcript_14514/m.36430 type:complete len:93 (+) Transcript_14514:77-355(+)